MYFNFIDDLSYIERLRLALEYSISEKHKKSLQNRINKIEIKEAEKNSKQLSFMGE